MKSRKFSKAILAISCALFLIIMVFALLLISRPFTYSIKRDSIDNSSDIITVASEGEYTGRFPDIVEAGGGVIAAYYWNSIHAPMVIGDPLGSIAMVKGDRYGDSFANQPYFVLDESFLIDSGLGLWTDGSEYFTDANEANAHDASFCIEVRDPNFARVGDAIVFTFFTRLPWDSTLGGHTYLKYEESCDYAYGRTYLMVSLDEGESWGSPVEIPCSYLNRGCAKRGNIAVLDDNTILIPLYGYSSEMGNVFTTAIVRATFNHGKWDFESEYCSHIDGPGAMTWGVFEAGVSEVSLAKLGNVIYALCRENGDVCISRNEGKTWVKKTSLSDKGIYLHQPSLQTVTESNQILASWSEPNEIGGRDIFLYLFLPESGWDYEDKYLIYHNDLPGDMGDPTSILLDNQTILTIYYDSQKGIVACTKTMTEKQK